MSRQPGSIVWGIQSRAGYPSKRAGSRCRYVLPAAINVKMRGTGLRPAPGFLESWQEGWQEWQGSNLRPPVLETGALPIELHSCRGPASPPIRAVSSIGQGRMARAKRLFERGVHEAAQHGPEVFALARTLRHEHGE